MREAETAARGSAVSRPRSAGWRTLLGRIGRAAIGVAILLHLFTFISIADVVAAFSAAEPGWLALAFGLLIADRFAGAIRVTILTRHLRMPLSVLENCEIALVSTFYGMLLPGTLAGGAVRWYRMSRSNRMHVEAAAAVTFDRLIGTIALVSLGLFFWLIERPPIPSPGLHLAFVFLLVALLGGLCFSLSRRATSIVLKPTARVANRLRLSRLSDGVDSVFASVQRFRHLPPGALAALIAAAVMRELVAIGFLVGFAHGLGLDVRFITLGWIGPVVNIALLLPLSFSGLGVREGAFVALLAPYDVSGSSALALAFLMLLAYLLIGGGGGILEVKNLLAGVIRPDDPPGCQTLSG